MPKDFARSQTFMYAVKVVISRNRCKMVTSLLSQTTNSKLWPFKSRFVSYSHALEHCRWREILRQLRFFCSYKFTYLESSPENGSKINVRLLIADHESLKLSWRRRRLKRSTSTSLNDWTCCECRPRGQCIDLAFDWTFFCRRPLPFVGFVVQVVLLAGGCPLCSSGISRDSLDFLDVSTTDVSRLRPTSAPSLSLTEPLPSTWKNCTQTGSKIRPAFTRSAPLNVHVQIHTSFQ